MPSSHTSSIAIPLSPCIRSHPSSPDPTPIIRTLGDAPNIPKTAKRSYYHLAILKHHHSNNENNNNNNNNNDNNNKIQFLLHMNKKNLKSISSPHSNRSGIQCHNFVSNSPGFYFSAIHLSKII